MAQVRKLNNGKEVPKIKGNISYNGTITEFSDEIYNKLVKNLDTGAASGVIRKGFDIGRQSGNTFYYDSEKNRAYVTNESGEKVWDYQGSIGRRSDFKVQWQGTFGRGNLNKNPNDVNRLLQSTMSRFNFPQEKEETPAAKKDINTDEISINLGENNTVSSYDAAYTNAKNRLALLSEYYTNPEEFTNIYNFEDSNLWKKYLDAHKDSVGELFGEKFSTLLNRISAGTYTNDDEEFLNSLKIKIVPFVKKNNDDGKLGKETDPNKKTGSGIHSGSGNGSGTGNNSSTDPLNSSDPINGDQNVFSNYYLPTFFDATVNKVTGKPEHVWTGAKSWTNPEGTRFLELTNNAGQRYYVVQHNSGKYLRSASDVNNIFLSEDDFWSLIENNNWAPTSPDTWNVEKWMPRSELVKTDESSGASVYGLENLSINGENIPIRKDINGPNYYAKLKSGSWIILSESEYNKLKTGDISVLKNKKAIQFYHKQGGILKMQNTPGGTIPVYDMYATYDVAPVISGNNAPISNWDKAAIVGTGVGTTGIITRLITTNPIARRVGNILSLLGYGTAALGNTVSQVKNNTYGWDDAAWTAYGLMRGAGPRPKQAMHYARTTRLPHDFGARGRSVRIGYGLKNYAIPGATRVINPITGAMGVTFGSIATNNLIQSIANDPNKTWDWNTWTTGDAQNFQMGMTGLGTSLNATANLMQNAQMRRHLPKNKYKFGSLDEAKFATQFKTRNGLQTDAVKYRMNYPIKEAFFGNPYVRAYNTAMWNRPGVKPFFTTSPAAFGLTGGLAPYTINVNTPIVVPDENINNAGTISPVKTIEAPVLTVPTDTIKMNGGVFFKDGGKILKMQNTPGGTIPYQNWLKHDWLTGYPLNNQRFQLQSMYSFSPRFESIPETSIGPIWSPGQFSDLVGVNTKSTTNTTPVTSQSNSSETVNPPATKVSDETISDNKVILSDGSEIDWKTSTNPEQIIKASIYVDDASIRQQMLDRAKELKMTPAVKSVVQDPESYKDDGDGKWAKTLSGIGSAAIPVLEGIKVFQSIGTTKKNTSEEIAAIRKSANLQQRSPLPLMQKSYDFSPEQIGFTKAVSQLNSGFRQFGSSTSDSDKQLAAFGSFAKTMSDLGQNMSSEMSKSKSTTDEFNTSMLYDWNVKEAERVATNNAIAANAIEKIAESKNTMRTNVSKDVNNSLSTLQNWIYGDRVRSANLEHLEATKNDLIRRLALDPDNEELKAMLTDVNLQIEEALQKIKILPSFKFV